MNIELKNVKHSQWASHETNCFEASIYINGKRAGTVENDGRGGCHLYHPHKVEEELNAYGKTLPKREAYGHEFEQNADTLIDDLLTQYLYSKDLKREMSRSIMFISTDDKLMKTAKMDAGRMINLLNHPDTMGRLKAKTILNLLPFDQALSTYRKGANHA